MKDIHQNTYEIIPDHKIYQFYLDAITKSSHSLSDVIQKLENTKLCYDYQVNETGNKTTITPRIKRPHFTFAFFANKKNFLSTSFTLHTHPAKSFNRESLKFKLNTFVVFPLISHPTFPALNQLLLEQLDKMNFKYTYTVPVSSRTARFQFWTKFGTSTFGFNTKVGISLNHFHRNLYVSWYKRFVNNADFVDHVDRNLSVIRAKYVHGQIDRQHRPLGQKLAFKFLYTPFADIQSTRFRCSLNTLQFVDQLFGVNFLNFEFQNRTVLSNSIVTELYNLRGFPGDLNFNEEGRNLSFRTYGCFKWNFLSHDYFKNNKMVFFGFTSLFVKNLDFTSMNYGFGFESKFAGNLRFELCQNLRKPKIQIRFVKD